jgi:hypothetical protein
VYDSSYLEVRARQLLNRARWVHVYYGCAFLLPAVVVFVVLRLSSHPSENERHLWASGAVGLVGSVIGQIIAAQRVFGLRLQAHTLLALVRLNHQIDALNDQLTHQEAMLSAVLSRASRISDDLAGRAETSDATATQERLDRIEAMVAQVLSRLYVATQQDIGRPQPGAPTIPPPPATP